jgi:hypothetical protein
LLLTVVGFSRPLYLPLFLPALLAIPRLRLRALGALALSVLGLTLVTASIHYALTDSWTGYGAVRTGFYAHTGYPEIDFPAADWTTNLDRLGNSAALSPAQALRSKKMPLSLGMWNAWYFLVGRHVGILPYFLPALLALARRPRGAARWGLILAVAVAVAAFLVLRPFNFYGGGGTVANRYFLPLYPALWFLPSRAPRLMPLIAAALAAGLFLAPSWRHSRSFPVTEEGTYRYVSSVAEYLLPFETSQSHLRLAGRDDLYPGFYVRLLSPELRTLKDGALRLQGGERAELLLGSIAPLTAVDLVLRTPLPGGKPPGGKGAGEKPAVVELDRGRLEPLDASGQRFRIHLPGPVARHAMWWTWKRAHLYRIVLRFPALRPSPEGGGGIREADFELRLPES